MLRTLALLPLVLAAAVSGARAQGLPRSQPKLLTIIRESVKPGHTAEHARHESGWPAAYEKAKSPDYYMALTSMTGTDEVWYLFPTESHAAYAESLKREDKDPVLAAEVARLGRLDAEFVSRVETIQAIARPDLGLGAFPDVSKVRYYEIATFHVIPGREQLFEEIARAYAAARKRAAPASGYRAYEIIAGASGSVYFFITSFENYGQLDQALLDSQATFKGFTPEETAIFAKMSDAVRTTENNRYRVDPAQSYVPKETRASDPEFWSAK